MLEKINIEQFGLFKNHQWDSIVRDKGNNVVNFGKENIIYGRNYSGKTTLSRIIRSIETKTISSKYINPQFEVLSSDNNPITQVNYTESNLNVRCFNEDFVKDNLSFIINHDSEIKPFAIIGENTGIEQQIQEIKNELGNNTDELKTLKYKELDELKAKISSKDLAYTRLKSVLNSQITDKATRSEESIKQRHDLFGDINYNSTKLLRDIKEVSSPNFIPINSELEQLNLDIIKEEEKDIINYYFNFNNFYENNISEIIELLNRPLLDSNKIAELLADPRLSHWVRDGYEVHPDRENCKCKFCGNTIQSSRWEQLDNHFDEESRSFENLLKNFKVQIKNEIDRLNNIKPPHQNLFYATYKEAYYSFLDVYNMHILNYITDLKFAISKIDERLNLISKPISYEYTPTFSQEEFNNIIDSYERIKDNNNEYSNRLTENIAKAQNELRLLEVKRFVDTIQYSNQQQTINNEKIEQDNLSEEEEVLSNYIALKEEEIESLTRQLNNEEGGAERVNEYLQSYFGNQNLELQAIEEESENNIKIKFNIIRDGSIAYHLSEGECSIISFCYFMARLDDIHTAGQKPIIFIDDPISSLDSNHIFYIYSIINSELFIKDRFEQIFISTHNLEFLKYLKRLKLTKNKHKFFIINRFQSHSEISIMPDYLKHYVTEFNFLFEQIYKCAKAEITTDENHHIYYNFGNNARKFLEALLFYKYPSKNANPKRLLRYFGDDQQATTLTDRVNNELSHLEEIFDRGMSPIDIPELKSVAQFILDRIKLKDEEQYTALLESIGVDIDNR